ncbi:transglutaminase family protein [Pseudovibrio sp. Tun.PSC04-5.I4]|uniref:transglutaminase-like domain-containing protein n=1 Tax=Pseudovibrio sp. Tun.PSC04-5.I4 TaxID=1798213 RepID=UPI000884652F|nr:transglutaminase family protein [Pseudovibrio sp. Tun.PSC04-5.I4]SDQ79640.1 Transglutaminase-like superfamily protein [Pseudovibrio sp. Tun.PSC04-5.I4]
MLDKPNTQLDILVQETQLLNFRSPSIRQLTEQRNWVKLSSFDRAGAVYDFVRNEILFGYNTEDNIPASQVLADGIGQCNTKGTLLMALMRAVGIPCRLHGFTIHKSLQRGVVPELIYKIAPDNILHSWVEVYLDGRWINLEGFILDDAFLIALQKQFAPKRQSLCGYGVGTNCLSTPQVKWNGQDTYIQKTGINNDFGTYESPDVFYAEHMQAFSPLMKLLYQNAIRHVMNWKTNRIRAGFIPSIPLSD